MNYIDHPVLYSDNFSNSAWKKIITKSSSRDGTARRRARKKMRKVVKELLNGVKPRI